MILPGSYANGFAPRDGQPLYPELWRGCVGAWAPCLGPTGLTLRDWSGFGRHGTLTNMDAGSDWPLSSGRYAIDLDGVNDYVVAPTIAITNNNISVSMWVRVTALASTYPRLIAMGDGTHSIQIVLDDFVGGNVLLNTKHTQYQSGTNATQWGYRPTVAAWEHIGVNFTPTTTQLFRNGVEQNGGASATVGAVATAGVFFGARQDLVSVTFFPGMLDDVVIANRLRTGAEFRVLASRRGIAYELAPRRRSRVFTGGFKAYWAARKALIQMAGSN